MVVEAGEGGRIVAVWKARASEKAVAEAVMGEGRRWRRTEKGV